VGTAALQLLVLAQPLQCPPPVGPGNFADEAKRRADNHKDSPFIAGYDDGYAETAPVGGFPAGASPYGALDMAGNVWEWCADWYDPSYCKTAPTRNPTGPPAGAFRVVRGGSWLFDFPRFLRGAFRLVKFGPSRRLYYLGFRCARGL
jgi:formylglycine-generating enzyme required for sulfatase activity